MYTESEVQIKALINIHFDENYKNNWKYPYTYMFCLIATVFK